MRVLQFAPQVCWPLDTGAKLRVFNLARALSAASTVTLLAFKERDETAINLPNAYERIVAIPRRGAYSFGKVLRGAIGSTPLPLLNYSTREMREALSGLVSENDFDIVQIESIHLMNYVSSLRTARSRPLLVCDWHNIESELIQRYSERQRNLARKIYARHTAQLMNKFERQALSKFDVHLTVSERDAEKLRALNSKARIFVIENGVDSICYANESVSSLRNRILFVGSMDYHANIEAAVNFGRTVWPRVRRKKSELIFTVVGRNPAPSVGALAAIDGIEVTGRVPDVRPFYREAVAAVVPLNVGGGSRLKILEAMACGVTVISTRVGAEGLHVKDGENILLVDSDEQLVDAIIKISEREDLRKQIASKAQALITERYDWSKIGAKLIDCYQHLLSARA